jgi:hypothetical protein
LLTIKIGVVMEMILGFLKSILEMYSAHIPQPVIAVLLIVGSLRFVLKPAFALAYAVTSITPSTKDDEAVKKLEEGKVVKAIKFGLDWLASVKLPAKK